MMVSRTSRLAMITSVSAAWLVFASLLLISWSGSKGARASTLQGSNIQDPNIEPLILAFEVAVVADMSEAQVGDTVDLTYWVTNTGNVIITSILVQRAGVSVSASAFDLIHPGEIVTGMIPVLVTIADWPGPLETGVNVVATGSNGDNMIKNATMTLPLHPNQTILPLVKRNRRRG